MPATPTNTPVLRFASSALTYHAKLTPAGSPHFSAAATVCGGLTASPLLMSPGSPDLAQANRRLRSPAMSFPTSGRFSPSVIAPAPSPGPRGANGKSYFDIGLGLSFGAGIEGGEEARATTPGAARARIVSAPTRLGEGLAQGRCSGLGFSLELPAPAMSSRAPSDCGSDTATVTARPSPAMVSTPFAAAPPKVRIAGIGHGGLASPAIRKVMVRRATPYPGKMYQDSYFDESDDGQEASGETSLGPAFEHLRV